LALILARAVNWFAQILIMILMARALLSWFARNPYSQAYRFYMVTVRLTEPFVAPCRKLMSRFNTGMFDFSVLLAFFLIEIVARIITLIILNVAY
jgi:YggT family protein